MAHAATVDIVAASLAIDAAGVGTGTGEDDALETQVSNLAASVDTSGIDLDNTGSLTITTVTSDATGAVVGVASTGGAVDITTTIGLTVSQAVSATGSDAITLVAAGSVGVNATITTPAERF